MDYYKKNWTPIILPFGNPNKKKTPAKPTSRPHSPKFSENSPGLKLDINYHSHYWNEIRLPNKSFDRRSYHSAVVHNKR